MRLFCWLVVSQKRCGIKLSHTVGAFQREGTKTEPCTCVCDLVGRFNDITWGGFGISCLNQGSLGARGYDAQSQ